MAPLGSATKRKAQGAGSSDRPPQKQATLSFGPPVGLSERPANTAESADGASAYPGDPAGEHSIKWHFCDPNKASRSRPGAAAAPRRPNQQGGSSGDRQVSTVLNLLNRGKQRRQAGGTATPSRAASSTGPGPSESPTLLDCLRRDVSGAMTPVRVPSAKSAASSDAPVDDLLSTILDDIANSTPSDIPEPSRAGASRSGTGPARGAGGQALGLLPKAQALGVLPKPSSDTVPIKSRFGATASAERPPAQKRTSIERPLLLEEALGNARPLAPRVKAAEVNVDVDPAGAARVPIKSVPSAPSSLAVADAAPLDTYPAHLAGALVLEVRGDHDGVWLTLDPDRALGPLPAGSSARPGLHVRLTDEWAATPARAGDRVHLIGLLRGCGCEGTLHQACGSLSRWCGALLVLRPETLVTGTQIASSCSCARKSVLSRMRKGGMEASAQMVLGSMKHELLEHILAQRQAADAAAAALAAGRGVGAPPLAAALAASAASAGAASAGAAPPSGRAGRDALVRSVIRRHLPELLALAHDDRSAASELRSAYDAMAGWVRDFLPLAAQAGQPSGPPAVATRPLRAGETVKLDEHGGQLRRAMAGFDGFDGEAGASVGAPPDKLPDKLRIIGVAATEFSLTSFPYGLKGNIDAVVEAELVRADGSVAAAMAVPLELKTGKHTPAALTDHQAQLLVYTLLMAEHNAAHVPVGVLFYSQFASADRRGASAVHADPTLLESLVIQRNLIVGGCAPHAIEEDRMPPMIRDERTCGYCFERQHCSVAHAALEAGTPETSGVPELFLKDVGHLSLPHLDYARRWLAMVDIEQRASERHQALKFTSGVAESEQAGTTLAHMELCAVEEFEPPAATSELDSEVPEIARKLLHRFRLASHGRLETKLGPGDLVSVSSMATAEGGGARARWMLASGIVKAVDAFQVAVLLPTRLTAVARGQLLRVDKEDIMSGFGTCRNNILALLTPRLRDDRLTPLPLLGLVVDLLPPRFVDADTGLAGLDVDAKRQLGELNVDQREAVMRVLCAQDYALILGMPGTGKTTVIAAAVRALVAQKKTVLLSAYTHSALDNVLLKLVELGVPLLRLGAAQGRVDPRLAPHCIERLLERAGTTAELAALLSDKLVVATTSLSLGHVLLQKLKFDVCIIDEAGQVTEPVCIGPMRCAERFVLVGDHYQLPPLVTEERAADLGLGVSLFSRLCEAHPHAVSRLRLQYRMSADIMTISNELIYSGQLRCGSQAVANATLNLPRLARARGDLRAARASADAAHWAAATAWAASGPGGAAQERGLGRQAEWLERALLPHHRVIFLDTDGAPAPEMRVATSRGNVYNPAEAALTAQLLAWFAAAGVPPEQMAYLSPYRAQLKEIRAALPPSLAAVEALTVDKAQGRDFECMVLSMVRSNEVAAIGSLLSDWRRLNVAFSRAKRKLVVVGSRSTLRHSPLLASFLEIVDRRGWCLELPPHAPQLYAMPPHEPAQGPPAASPGAGLHASKRVPSVSESRPITANLVHEAYQQAPALVRAAVGGTSAAARGLQSDW